MNTPSPYLIMGISLLFLLSHPITWTWLTSLGQTLTPGTWGWFHAHTNSHNSGDPRPEQQHCTNSQELLRQEVSFTRDGERQNPTRKVLFTQAAVPTWHWSNGGFPACSQTRFLWAALQGQKSGIQLQTVKCLQDIGHIPHSNNYG